MLSFIVNLRITVSTSLWHFMIAIAPAGECLAIPTSIEIMHSSKAVVRSVWNHLNENLLETTTWSTLNTSDCGKTIPTVTWRMIEKFKRNVPKKSSQHNWCLFLKILRSSTNKWTLFFSRFYCAHLFDDWRVWQISIQLPHSHQNTLIKKFALIYLNMKIN